MQEQLPRPLASQCSCELDSSDTETSYFNC